VVRSRKDRALKHIIAEIRKGPATRRDFGHIPDSTYYDNEKRAEYLGVAKKLPDGRLAWIDYSPLEFHDEAELRAHLEHSRKLTPALEKLCVDSRVKDLAGETQKQSTTDPITTASALMHLKTGYAQISRLYERTKESEKEIQLKEKQFCDSVKAKLARDLPTELLDIDAVTKLILNDIKSFVLHDQSRILPSLHVEGEEVKAGKGDRAPVLGKGEMADRLKQFIQGEEESTENRKNCENMLGLQQWYSGLRTRLEQEVKHLIRKVDHGEPLEGSCELCPRVKIKLETTKASV